MATHAMIDIVTLGLAPSSVVIHVSGLKFNPKGKQARFAGRFTHRLNIEEQERLGRTTDADTFRWWQRQKRKHPDLYKRVFPRPNTGMRAMEAMRFLREWCAECEVYWSHGAHDFLILNHMFAEGKVARPWEYWQCSDVRTIARRFARNPIDAIKHEPHDPMACCQVQARCVQKAFRDFNFER